MHLPNRLHLALAALLALSTLAQTPPQPPPAPWSAQAPRVEAEVSGGHPLVVYVVVPLCSNSQINCGSAIAGKPGDLAHNIYWGAIFGARRFLERKNSGWTKVEVSSGTSPLLERVVFRRTVEGTRWGLASGSVEQLVVLQAVHGDQINSAVEHFWRVATEGGKVSFQDGSQQREERIHIVGYAGHNRLMDGVTLPPAPPPDRRAPISAFVLACSSESYFGAPLRAAGVQVLLTTRTLMAPEGYLVEAVARSLGERGAVRAVRAAAIDASVRWQSLAYKDAAWIFMPL